MAFGDIFRIERHTFKVAFEPVETKVAYRIICGSDVKLRPRATDGSDTIATDDANASVSDAQVPGNSSGLNLDSSIALEDDLTGTPGVDGANHSIDADDADIDADFENDDMESVH